MPKYWILLLLALVFMAPGLAAYLYYQHPAWLRATTTNRGELLQSPVLLTALKGKAKWHLILWQPGDCRLSCLKQLDKLARIRLALGRRLYEVEQWLVLTDDSKRLPKTLVSSLQDQDIHVLPLSKEQRQNLTILGSKSQLFIANSANYLILSYEATADPGDIFHDLKQLLTSAKKGG